MSLPVLLLIALLPLSPPGKEAATLYLEDGDFIDCTVRTGWNGIYTNSTSLNKIRYWIGGKRYKIEKTKVKEVMLANTLYYKLMINDYRLVYKDGKHIAVNVSYLVFAEKVVTGTNNLYEHFYTNLSSINIIPN